MIGRLDTQQITQTWSSLSDTIFVARNENEYEQLVALLDTLTDQVGEDENNPLASMMDVVGALIENYENAHVPELQPLANVETANR